MVDNEVVNEILYFAFDRNFDLVTVDGSIDFELSNMMKGNRKYYCNSY